MRLNKWVKATAVYSVGIWFLASAPVQAAEAEKPAEATVKVTATAAAPAPAPAPLVAAAPLVVVEAKHDHEHEPEARLKKSVLVEGGTTFAFASVGSQYDGNCCRNGLLVGARVDWEISDNLSLFPGLRYVQKGGRARTAGADLMIALNYLEIPLQVKYRFTNSWIRPYIFGGPNIAFLLNAQSNLYGVALQDLSYVTSSTDFSLEVGFGVDMPIDERFSIVFANSMSFGLNDIDNSLDSWHSRTFQITGGIKLSLP